jgi:hypothetical protein
MSVVVGQSETESEDGGKHGALRKFRGAELTTYKVNMSPQILPTFIFHFLAHRMGLYSIQVYRNRQNFSRPLNYDSLLSNGVHK